MSGHGREKSTAGSLQHPTVSHVVAGEKRDIVVVGEKPQYGHANGRLSFSHQDADAAVGLRGVHHRTHNVA